MTGGKFFENFAFNHERMRPANIDEYRGQIFIPGGLRCAVDCHRYWAGIWLPTPECIEAGEG
jgi:hypothetical protein